MRILDSLKAFYEKKSQYRKNQLKYGLETEKLQHLIPKERVSNMEILEFNKDIRESSIKQNCIKNLGRKEQLVKIQKLK